MGRPPYPRDWRSAAANATFAFYRAIRPEPDATWAGGYGYSDDSPNHIGVAALVRGAEVTVDTSVRERRRMPPGMEQRNRISEAIFHHLAADDTLLDLPATVRIESEERLIEVDGEMVAFAGVRVANSPRWSGSAALGDALITITTTDPGTVLAIAPADTDLDEFPPRPSGRAE